MMKQSRKKRLRARGESPIPDPRHIVSRETLVAADGKRYEVIHTNERDPYDEPRRKRSR